MRPRAYQWCQSLIANELSEFIQEDLRVNAPACDILKVRQVGFSTDRYNEITPKLSLTETTEVLMDCSIWRCVGEEFDEG